MKKSIIFGFAVFSLFVNIQPSHDITYTFAVNWLSPAVAQEDVEHVVVTGTGPPPMPSLGMYNTGGGGSGGGGGGQGGNTGGGHGNGGGGSEEEEEPNRAQCIANSAYIATQCNAGPLSLHTSTIRSCSNYDFTVETGASAGIRIFLDLNASTSITVRSYDSCTDTADSVRDGFLNDCAIAHTGRVTKCPAK